MNNEENFQGGGTSISNLRHPAQQQQMLQQQPPQGQPMPQQQQMMHQQQYQQQMMQQPARPIQNVPKSRESFTETIKNKPWKEIFKGFVVMLVLFFLFASPEFNKFCCKRLLPFDKQNTKGRWILHGIFVTIISIIVTLLNWYFFKTC